MGLGDFRVFYQCECSAGLNSNMPGMEILLFRFSFASGNGDVPDYISGLA